MFVATQIPWDSRWFLWLLLNSDTQEPATRREQRTWCPTCISLSWSKSKFLVNSSCPRSRRCCPVHQLVTLRLCCAVVVRKAPRTRIYVVVWKKKEKKSIKEKKKKADKFFGVATLAHFMWGNLKLNLKEILELLSGDKATLKQKKKKIINIIPNW